MEFKEIATGLKFPEGPVAMDDGSVIIVEIPIGRITRVTMDGKLHTVATPGGGPNGLAVGPDGHLYCCNNGGNFEMNIVNGLMIPGHTPPDHKGGRISASTSRPARSTFSTRNATGRSFSRQTTSSSIPQAASGSPIMPATMRSGDCTARCITPKPMVRRSPGFYAN